jgi:hypothetical protein
MARTGQTQAQQAQQQYITNAASAYNVGQEALQSYMANEERLAKGANVGADPWLNPTYLATQNRLTANATSGENSAAAQQMRDAARRSGGTNTGATNYAIKDLALRKMRMADTLNAQRQAQDYNKNIAYQSQLAAAPLAAAQAETPYYGTSTSGQNASLNDLVQFGLASYGPWNDLISGVAGAGGAFLGGYGYGMGKGSQSQS